MSAWDCKDILESFPLSIMFTCSVEAELWTVRDVEKSYLGCIFLGTTGVRISWLLSSSRERLTKGLELEVLKRGSW